MAGGGWTKTNALLVHVIRICWLLLWSTASRDLPWEREITIKQTIIRASQTSPAPLSYRPSPWTSRVQSKQLQAKEEGGGFASTQSAQLTLFSMNYLLIHISYVQEAPQRCTDLTYWIGNNKPLPNRTADVTDSYSLLFLSSTWSVQIYKLSRTEMVPLYKTTRGFNQHNCYKCNAASPVSREA